AEMVSPRDVDKVLSVLRRLYDLIIVDVGVTLDELNLAFLDQADNILQIVVQEQATLRTTSAVTETFAKIAYPPYKAAYLVRRTPFESTIYLGDNARAPYGTRPDEEVRAFSTESIDALVARDVKAVVVACNTSTAVALGDLRRRYDLPVLGVIRPGAVTASL